MCVVSMIRDHYQHDWIRNPEPLKIEDVMPAPLKHPDWTWAKWNEYQELLKKAAEYDARNNEPDCEDKLKKQIDKQIEEYLKNKFGDNK